MLKPIPVSFQVSYTAASDTTPEPSPAPFASAPLMSLNMWGNPWAHTAQPIWLQDMPRKLFLLLSPRGRSLLCGVNIFWDGLTITRGLHRHICKCVLRPACCRPSVSFALSFLQQLILLTSFKGTDGLPYFVCGFPSKSAKSGLWIQQRKTPLGKPFLGHPTKEKMKS